MSNRLFVTGSQGFLGSHLLPKLIELGYEVVTDMRYLEMERWNCIIHLAATTHTRTEFDPNIYYNNFFLTHKVFNQPGRIIYASSCSARHNTTPYASSKLWSEFLGDKHGNALGLRFFNLYGPGNNKGIVKFLMDQPDGAKVTIRGENLIRDYLEVNDAANYVIYCLENGSTGIVDVGTGVGISTIDLVSLYSLLSGKIFEIETIPPDPSEPICMVSDNIVPHVSLGDGLKSLIANETKK